MRPLKKKRKHVLIPRFVIYFLYTPVQNDLKYLFFVRDTIAFPDSITTQVVAALNKKKKY
jgi:hypothetical protein